MASFRRTAAALGVAALSFASVGSCSAGPAATKGERVAVFSQPGFPYNNIPALVLPDLIASDLKKAGVTVDTLDVRALSDPARLNAQRYAAVVLPYGNAYPAPAFANLQAFHRAGGSLVLSGIPFTHAYAHMTNAAKKEDSWNDQGHDSDPALFGANGIGVGGFAGPDAANGGGQIVIPPDDPLHLRGLLAGTDPGDLSGSQWLDTDTLPKTVTVTPALTYAGKPLIALLTHKGDGFDRAVDAWTYRGPDGELSAYATRQLLERGTLAVLAARGQLPADRQEKAFAMLDTLPRPHVWANVVLPTVPRPYPTFQPKMPPLAPHLMVVDMRHADRDTKLLLMSLQGIVNRKQPRIYLNFDDDDQFWLDELQRQKDTGTPIPVADPLSLVKQFRSEFKGGVISDPKIYDSPCVAVSLAGVDDLLLATPEQAKALNLPIVTDLRGKFKDNAEALHYLRTEVAPRANPYLTCCLNPWNTIEHGALDQIIAARGTLFWITGPKVQATAPGANEPGEMEEVKALLASLPLGAIVRGFWWSGDGVGLVEDEGVALGSRFGKITVVSDLINNLSVHSGVVAPKLMQKPRPPAPAYDPSKVYLCFTMSDGDNLCTWRGYFRHYYSDPARGSVPIGWGMGPTLVDLAPDWARWFYQNATPNDEFICDVSGVGYIYPPSWGTALKNREDAFKFFYGQTQAYMDRMDMKTVRLMNVGAKDIDKVGGLMPGVSFLMPDYGYAGAKTYDHLTYDLPDTGQAVFRAATNGKGPENLAQQIRERAGTGRPAFVNAFIWNWGSTPSDLKKVLEILGPEYVAVTPSQLYTLYRQAKPQPAKTAQAATNP